MTPGMRITQIGWMVGLAGLCSVGGAGWTLANAGNESTAAVQAAFVLWGPAGQLQVHALTPGAQCPVIQVDGYKQIMDLRVGPQNEPESAEHPAIFPIRVCETVLPGLPRQLSVNGQPLPVPARSEVRKIVLLGDTGCRIKGLVLNQACNDPAQWPLAQVARSAARESADLVIHVGDYLYREGACRRAGCAASPHGYGWDSWRADFFDPMQPLLASAPWVLVRGNHESCARAGQGWFRFLDPHPYGSQPGCAGMLQNGEDMSAPYAVPLDATHQLIVLDSAPALERKSRQDAALTARFVQQFQGVSQLTRGRAHNWLVLHHDLLGYGYLPLLGYQSGNYLLQNALTQVLPAGLGELPIQLVLQGHIHTFQLNRFAGSQPLSLITGFGGALLEPDFPDWIPPSFEPAPGARLLETYNDQQFGYTVLERLNREQWRLTEKDASGMPRLTCLLQLGEVPYGFDCTEQRPGTGHHLRVQTLPEGALRADYLLLGEVHDNAAGHALRLDELQQLGAGGKRVLAMEQLDADHQSALDQAVQVWQSAAPQERSVRLVAEAGGFDFKGWKWELYEPVLHWALDHVWPIAATNLSRKSLGALLRDPKGMSPEPRHWSAEQRQSLLQEVRTGHCNLLPEEEVARMAGAQRSRDATMARALVQWHQASGLPVVFLAGNGHLRKDLAVPVWLQQLDPLASVYTLAVLERGQEEGGSLTPPYYDLAEWVAPQSRPDPCVALRQRLEGKPPRTP